MPESAARDSLPSCIAEPPGVHFAHQAHANDADLERLHAG